MISERKFVSAHTSFWRVAMPMGEAFMRAVNTNLPSFMEPRGSLPDTRYSLVSEYSFRVWAEAVGAKGQVQYSLPWPDETRRQLIAGEVSRYIQGLDHRPVEPMQPHEIQEGHELAQRLHRFLLKKHLGETVIPRPQFPGCGIIDDCVGDCLVGTTLYELKNVERDFRLADLRQVLCYCALNAAADRYRIDAIGLVNARSGGYYTADVTVVSLAAAGAPAADLYSEIAHYISTEAGSR